MHISPLGSSVDLLASTTPPAQLQSASGPAENPELRKAFEQFVGETFYREMLKAMRQTVHKPAYFHGGKGEEIFQQQLDQILSEKLAETTSDQFSGPMYELFTMQRR
ncbi:MAG: rod-binding protein [Planctomycetota bacterium]